MRVLLLVLVLLLMISPAAAQSLGKPGYGGPGCPGGTASVSLSRDGKSLSVSFDRYQVATKGSRSFDRKACSLAIPVKVPAGKSVSIIAFEFRGYNRLPAGAKSTFKAEYFFAGGRGQVFTRTFNGPKTGAFSTSDTAVAVWSGCGASVTLRTNSSLLVNGKSASASIRSQDVKTAIVYRLRWRDC